MSIGLQSRSFIGSAFLVRKAGQFSFGAWVADAFGDSVKPHGHAQRHFMFVIGGEYETAAEGARNPSLPTFVFNPADTFHRDRFLRPQGTFFSLSIDDDFETCDEVSTPKAPTILAGAAATALVRRLLRTCSGWDVDSEGEAESLSLELVSIAANCRTGRHAPRWLRRACESINDGHHRKIRISELAKSAGVHPVHFARTFRRVMGCSAGDYLRGVRLRRAVEMLSSTRTDLVDVAIAAGFADQAHLTHQFSANFGVAPGRFRRLISRNGCRRLLSDKNAQRGL